MALPDLAPALLNLPMIIDGAGGAPWPQGSLCGFRGLCLEIHKKSRAPVHGRARGRRGARCEADTRACCQPDLRNFPGDYLLVAGRLA